MPIVARLARVLGTGCTLICVAACSGGKSKPQPEHDRVAATQAQQQRSPDASAVTPQADGPVMDGDHSVIRSESVGPLRVGEWRRIVMSFVYAISARAGRDSEDIIVVRGIGKDTVTLTFDNDTLRRIFVTHTGPRTASGIGIGSPFSLVAQQPGAATVKHGEGHVTTVGALCGVEFATDSLALSADSSARRKATASPAVRAISVGYCKH